MPTLKIFAIVLFVLGAFLAGLLVAEIRNLRRENADCKNRIAHLEEANSKRMNYRTLEEIEDAMAVLNNEYFRINIKKEFLDNMKAHLFNARNPDGK